MIILGSHFLGIIRIPMLNREARLDASDKGGSAVGAYVLGLAFAFGWTSCIGPQLGAIMSIAAQESSVQRGTMLLAVYSVGLGLSFRIAAAFIDQTHGMMAHMKLIQRIMGVLLAGVGTARMTGVILALVFWLLKTFPALGQLG